MMMYNFKGRITRCDGYYTLRDISRAATITIIESRVVCRDRCMERYVPYGSQTERQRVCIVREDMHLYLTLYLMALHIFIIDEL